MTKSQTRTDDEISQRILRHWHEAVPNDRLAHLVKDTTRGFLRSLQARLAQRGVTLGHWTYLRILWERDGLTQRELSYEAGVMEPSVVTALRGMEELGYITREKSAENRKNVYVHLTPKGRKLKAALVPLAEEVNALATKGIPAANLSLIRNSLLTMIDNLAQDDVINPSAQRAPDDAA